MQMAGRYKRSQSQVFYITFVSYGLLHLSRKSYTCLKVQLQEDAHYDPALLSIMDTMFMLFYSIGSFQSGSVGALYQYPAIVAIGLFGSSLCVLLLAISVWARLEEQLENPILRYGFPVSIWMLHGLMQSTGGPANTAIMSNWFGYANRGYIFGLWVCHQYVGNIVAALLAGLVLSTSTMPWTFALIIPAAANCLWGFVCLTMLPERPERVAGLEKFRQNPLLSGHFNPIENQEGEPADITFTEAIQIPHVKQYSLAFGLFKFANYAIFFWLPFYLSQYFSPRTSNLVSIVYDLGMIPGGILVGTLSDMFGGRRACVIALFTVTLIPFLAIFAQYGVPWPQQPTPALLLLLAVIGCLIGGPINIITSAVAVDLSENSRLAGRNDLMAVTGIINGSGSIVAAMGLIMIGPLQSRYGWRVVWYLITACIVLGTLLLSPAIRKELTRVAVEPPRPVSISALHRNYQSISTHSASDDDEV